MANPESKGGQAIARKMEQIEPGTPRYDALDVAKKFKTSWVELGGKLWEVRNKKWFKEWGFTKFEDYCREELKIKPRTAAKLTASYGFLKNEEPSVLRRDGIKKPVPDMQVVDMLRRVREREQVPEREFSKIKELAFEDAPLTDIRKELKQHRPDPEPPSRSKVIKQLLNQAHRLADNLAAVTGIPHAIIDRALALVDDLRSLVDPNGD